VEKFDITEKKCIFAADIAKKRKMLYSFIIPVFNRPDEVWELLESLTRQTQKDFEVIIVEDGSEKTCKAVCEDFADRLDIHYYYKENSGPGQSRNYGAERAHGEWLIVLDSDVVLPSDYLHAVDSSGVCRVDSEEFATAIPSPDGTPVGDFSLFTLHPSLIAAWGGPDAAHPDFTPVQKAISYSMTSFFTTGGIRGGKAKLDKFYPRSYNMGIRREVYLKLGGFSKMRFGEDIDFSYRIVEAGYQTRLIPKAWVWHKRRTDFRKFFRQVYNSGIARINLEKRHPGTLKLVHLLPTLFTVGVIALILISAVGRALMHYVDRDQFYWMCFAPWLPIIVFSAVIFADSAIRNRSLWVGLLSVPAAFVQLMGYGLGFIESWWKRCVLKQDEFTAFEKTFYK
jgi:glycosyltransferase involved in cell wall biosynthesis